MARVEDWSEGSRPMSLEITPEQMAAYRATARRRAKDKRERTLQRFWAARRLAQEGAVLLRTRFGATSVWLFGSLAHEDTFGLRSDIDLAVRGIDPEEFFLAVAFLQDLSLDFEVDLVDIDRCRPALRAAIERTGVAI
jgi:predicted nucleotidyltransferase